MNAHETLKELLEGVGEEEGDGDAHAAVQRHGDEDATGPDGVAHHHVDEKGDEDNDLGDREVAGQVGGSQHGALHQVDDLLPMVGNRGWFNLHTTV